MPARAPVSGHVRTTSKENPCDESANFGVHNLFYRTAKLKDLRKKLALLKAGSARFTYHYKLSI